MSATTVLASEVSAAAADDLDIRHGSRCPSPSRGRRREGRGLGPLARPVRSLPSPTVPGAAEPLRQRAASTTPIFARRASTSTTAPTPQARACSVEEFVVAPAVLAAPVGHLRLTERGIAVILIAGVMVVLAAVTVVGLTALRVTGDAAAPLSASYSALP